MRALAITCFMLVVVPGCGDDDDTGTDAATDGGGGDDTGPPRDGAPSDGAGPAAIVVEGDYFRIATGATTPVEGVRVCIEGHPEIACATTNAMGTYRLENVPTSADLLLDFTKEGYAPAMRSIHTPAVRDMALFGFAYGDDDFVSFFEMVLELTLDPAMGIVVFEATEATVVALSHNGLEHVTAVLDPTSGVGPNYATAQYLPSATLTETSSAGWGFFVNVEPGEYEVTFQHPERVCSAHPELGWAAPEGSGATTRVRVSAGYVTYTNAFCGP